jgi:hypothetical protein
MMHCRVVSQQPVEQALPPQHAWPGDPHCRQKPPWQAVPLVEQLPPAQQTWPIPPHAVQRLLLHAKPEPQGVPPGQQA